MAIAPRFSPEIKLQNLGQELQNILTQLERGQPQSPLGTHVQELLRESSQGGLGLSCVGLDKESMAAVLAWLFGIDGPSAAILSSVDVLIDVKVHRDRYSVTLPYSAVTEYADAAALASALPQLLKEAAATRRAVHITIPERADLQGVDLCIWTGTVKDGLGVATYNEMLRTTSVLIVAGSAEYRLHPEEKAELHDLVAGIAAVWPVVSDVRKEVVRSGWWEDSVFSHASLKLPAAFLEPAELFVTPVFLRDGDDAARRLLEGARTARRMVGSVDALGDGFSREVSRIRALRAREERMGRFLEQNSGSVQERDQIEALRELIDKQFHDMDGTIQEQNRKALLPAGNVNLAVQNVLNDLRESDIDQEDGHSTIKLTLGRDFQEHLLNAAKVELKNQYRDDMYVLSTGFSACRDVVKAKLEAMTGTQAPVAQMPFDENAIWQMLRDAMALELKYRGEMPKRGILQRLGEGKKEVLGLLGIMSLIALLMGESRNAWIKNALVQYALIAIFFIVIAYTFINWRKEDNARLEKELDRVRDQLSSEVKRLIGEIQREKMTRIAEMMNQARRDLQKRVETMLREELMARTEKISRQRQENRDKQRTLEQRSRDLQGLPSQLAKLKQGAVDIELDIKNELREVGKEAKAT